MPYEPAFPFPFGLAIFGVCIRSVKLASGVPGSEYTVIVLSLLLRPYFSNVVS